MNAIDFLKSVAQDAATAAGLKFCVERSGLSEALYFRVRRGGEWFGLRIASHAPVYESSADYEQVLVPLEANSADQLALAAARVRVAVVSGGLAVADPAEIEAALQAARVARRNGVRVRRGERTVWEWVESLAVWQLVRVRNRLPRQEEHAALARFRPQVAPCVRLGAIEESALRHRYNLRARWAYDAAREWAAEQQTGDRPSPAAPEPRAAKAPAAHSVPTGQALI